jgi:malonyl-CoA O-methyltransferase
MNVQKSYNQWAATYDTDENLTRDLDGIATRQTLGQRHWQAILELGCGTGKNTVFLAQLAAAVTALDFSPEMMTQAQAKVQASHVTFAIADISQRWPITDQSIDLISCNLILEHIEDLGFIFAEAARSLRTGGQFFISELHPFKQYEGSKARFEHEGETAVIPAFIHHISDFLDAATDNGFKLLALKEWWHEHDENKPPRLVSFLFEQGNRFLI